MARDPHSLSNPPPCFPRVVQKGETTRCERGIDKHFIKLVKKSQESLADCFSQLALQTSIACGRQEVGMNSTSGMWCKEGYQTDMHVICTWSTSCLQAFDLLKLRSLLDDQLLLLFLKPFYAVNSQKKNNNKRTAICVNAYIQITIKKIISVIYIYPCSLFLNTSDNII